MDTVAPFDRFKELPSNHKTQPERLEGEKNPTDMDDVILLNYVGVKNGIKAAHFYTDGSQGDFLGVPISKQDILQSAAAPMYLV